MSPSSPGKKLEQFIEGTSNTGYNSPREVQVYTFDGTNQIYLSIRQYGFKRALATIRLLPKEARDLAYELNRLAEYADGRYDLYMATHERASNGTSKKKGSGKVPPELQGNTDRGQRDNALSPVRVGKDAEPKVGPTKDPPTKKEIAAANLGEANANLTRQYDQG